MPTSPGTRTTRDGNMNSISADRDLPLAMLEDMGKVPGMGQQLHHSILMEERGGEELETKWWGEEIKPNYSLCSKILTCDETSHRQEGRYFSAKVPPCLIPGLWPYLKPCSPPGLGALCPRGTVGSCWEKGAPLHRVTCLQTPRSPTLSPMGAAGVQPPLQPSRVPRGVPSASGLGGEFKWKLIRTGREQERATGEL